MLSYYGTHYDDVAQFARPESRGRVWVWLPKLQIHRQELKIVY